jgi:molecular chaperone Hsp33
VEAACGFVVQALPGASDESLAQAEANVRALGPPAERLRAGETLPALVEHLLDGLGHRLLETRVPVFHCGCDAGRALRAVALLGREELDQAVAEGEPLDVRCDFCGDRYAVDPVAARALLARAPSDAERRAQ